MITTTEKTTITCDKCGKSCTAHNDIYNDVFFSEGWALYPNTKKYQHVCYECQPRKHQKSHDFVAGLNRDAVAHFDKPPSLEAIEQLNNVVEYFYEKG